MLILTRAQVAGLITMEQAIDAVEKGFASLAEGDVVMPQRVATPVEAHAGLHLSMPVYVGTGTMTSSDALGAEVLAVKVVTVYRHNAERFGLPMIHATLLLHEAASGRVLALMDAEHLTAVRTGAASGVATRHLAREDASTLLIFGAGALAFHQVEAVCAVRPIEKVFVTTRTGVRDAALCAQVSERLTCQAVPARDLESALRNAAVICTATNTTSPLFDGSLLRPGCHINAVGAYTRTMRELDANAVRNARVFVDRLEAAETEAGDLVMAAGEESVASLVAGELGDVILGRVPGRRNADEITLFKSVGLAMQDAVTAVRVYRAALDGGVGLNVDLSGS